jgi:ABC-2 type transport system permease protein
MALRPGSLFWLMRHELRLLYRGTTRKARNLIWVVLVFAVFHLAAIPVAGGMHLFAKLSPAIPLLLVSGMLVLLGLTLAARSLTLAVQTVYERGDLDLLLSSPLDGRTLFSVRAGTLVVALCYELGVLVLPFANVFAAFGHVRWLLAYLALPLAAALAISGSLWFSLALVRWLGARPTRLVAQVLAGMVGICAAIATQIPRLVSGRDTLDWLASPSLLARLPDEGSPVWIPARALMGDALWTPLVYALCLGTFVWSVRLLGARFIEGLATTAGVARKRAARSRVRRFRSGVYTSLARKELRLLLRDPWLLTQLLQQNLYLLPIMFVFARLRLHGLPCMWLVVVVCAGTTASAFAWLAASGEEAPELLGTAPISARHLTLAQLSASVFPVLLGAAVCCALLVLRDPLAAGVLFACSAGNAACNAVLHVRVKRPAKRHEFLRRNQANLPLLLAELIFLAGWVGLAVLLLALL